MMRRIVALAAAAGISAFAAAEPTVAEIENEIAASARETAALQARLKDRVSLAAYSSRVRAVNGTNVWTDALQAALREHEIVVIPARAEKYWIDGTVTIPSNRRIEADGATVSLIAPTRVLMLRNERTADGTLVPVRRGAEDDNVAIVGGRWEDWADRRMGYGTTGRYDAKVRERGKFWGVSTLFLFNNVRHVTLRGVTFVHTSGFAMQAGDGSDFHLVDTAFDRCFADGYHLNGNLERVHVKNARGHVGDDLVALNSYDWLNSSVNFGPQRAILCEDLALVPAPGRNAYPAIRIQPAVFKYADGSTMDCAISDVVFRRVKGVTTFKMYLQTPRYEIGREPEWGAVGSGGNLHFEEIEIDLDRPLDMFGGYATSDPLRGHFGAFEFGANLTSIYFKDVAIRFHADKWPLTHLATVGPKSSRVARGAGKADWEIFDPYVSCRVGKVRVEGLRVSGVAPKELVRATVFDDVNRDGRSSGRGVIDKLEIVK